MNQCFLQALRSCGSIMPTIIEPKEGKRISVGEDTFLIAHCNILTVFW